MNTIVHQNVKVPNSEEFTLVWKSFFSVASAIATFRTIILAHLKLQLQRNLLSNPPGKLNLKENKKLLNPRVQMPVVIFCQKVAIISFCIAFICLAIYGYLRTI